MPAFAHTPYDGSKKPFTIGLEPLDPARWIEPDEHLVRDLADKDRLLGGKREVVFAAEAWTEDAQREVWDLLAEHLPRQFPGLYVGEADGIRILPADHLVRVGDDAAIVSASRLVQEDLLLMRRHDTGYRLVAASLCFPSSWSLQEKFGGNLDRLHDNVPGYTDQLRVRMARIFDNLKAELPVTRLNWSIMPDGDLHHPQSKSRPRDWFRDRLDAFIRVERQTLRRLPASGDILFTIKILTDPFDGLKSHPRGRDLAQSLADQVRALSPEQMAYKNLLDHREALLAALEGLATGV
jgi:dimethylamine monooxygenase subunit A